MEAVISVADQKWRCSETAACQAVSGLHLAFRRRATAAAVRRPSGRLKVCEKLGEHLAPGTVIKHRQATGEVLAVNAPGRDPIVTRILWLEGCESQNANARGRSIYIHGTPEESKIGKPVSWGCIRMRSEDVIALFEALPVGASVTIIHDRLPRYPKFVPKPVVREEVLVASRERTAQPARTASSATLIGPPVVTKETEKEPVKHVAAVASAGPPAPVAELARHVSAPAVEPAKAHCPRGARSGIGEAFRSGASARSRDPASHAQGPRSRLHRAHAQDARSHPCLARQHSLGRTR